MADEESRLYEPMQEEKVIEIEIERLRDFHNHPFKIREDRQMKSLMESVEKYGILTPLIVRPVPEGVYEIISGHRRRFVAKMLGYRKVPVIIRVMKDDEAVIAMIDANNQRKEISISEKAFAYKVEMVACRNQEVVIASNRYPAELVRSRFLKLRYDHITYVMDRLEKNTGKVRNIRKYLLATLFNAPATMDGYYRAEVRHDMPVLAQRVPGV